MKRWIVWLLAMCIACLPAAAFAQPVTTEQLLLGLMQRLLMQIKKPSFSLGLQEGDAMMEACLALDRQGVPDFSLGMQSGEEFFRLDADAQGLRYEDQTQSIGMTIDTLMNVLTTDENGVHIVPDVREEDCALFSQIAAEIGQSAMKAVSVQEIISEPKEQETQEQAEEVQQNEPTESVTRITIDLCMLLAELDASVPASLRMHGEELNALMMRNEAWIRKIYGADQLPDFVLLADAWPAGLFSGLIPDGKAAEAVIDLHQQQWILNGR